ncbi:MAG: hypothetical protein MUF54_11920, partial [Polyangiaceae bacterium]|nr:hypothetical protein [Polyangiaceae bacterium]
MTPPGAQDLAGATLGLGEVAPSTEPPAPLVLEPREIGVHPRHGLVPERDPGADTGLESQQHDAASWASQAVRAEPSDSARRVIGPSLTADHGNDACATAVAPDGPADPESETRTINEGSTGDEGPGDACLAS